MARKYHSPSSIELGRRCKRAWYHRYIDGIRRPEIPWSESLKGRDRSLALGTALHTTLERHFMGLAPDWIWFPGQVAASGVKHLPEPHTNLAIERGVGELTGVSIGPGHDGEPRFTVTIGGVPWLGYRDLTDYSGPADGKPGLYDYKSTKSINKYAKSAAELLQDLQANLYAYDTMTELEQDELLCRWVYFETDRRRFSEPRDFIVKRAEALSVIECAAEVAKELDAIDHIDQAHMNPGACPDFGGCEFHVKAGGPCSAHVPVGALIQARVPKKKDQNMPLNPNARANLAKQFSNGQAPAGNTGPAADVAPSGASTPPVSNPGPAADGAATGNTTTTTTTTTNEQTGTARTMRKGKNAAAGSFAQLAEALTNAEAAHAQALAELEAAKENMRKALA